MRIARVATLAAVTLAVVCLAPAAAVADLALAPAFSNATVRSGTSAFAEFSYLAANDWTSNSDLSGKWSRQFNPRPGRNIAFASLRAELGSAMGPWRLSVFHREEALGATNRDTLDAVYRQYNKLPIPVGTEYRLSLEADRIAADGIKVGRRTEWALGSATGAAEFSISAFEAKKGGSANVHGTMAATAPGTFAFDAAWTNAYTGKVYPFITPGTPSASGHSIDAAMEFSWGAPDARHRTRIAAADLSSRLKWRGIPTTDASANSSTAGRDADGFIVYKPAMSGMNRRTDLIQSLAPKISASYQYASGRWAASAGALVILREVIPSIGLDFAPGADWRLGGYHDFRFRTQGLKFGYKYFDAAIFSNSWKLSSASAYGLTLTLLIPFQ